MIYEKRPGKWKVSGKADVYTSYIEALEANPNVTCDGCYKDPCECCGDCGLANCECEEIDVPAVDNLEVYDRELFGREDLEV